MLDGRWAVAVLAGLVLSACGRPPSVFAKPERSGSLAAESALTELAQTTSPIDGGDPEVRWDGEPWWWLPRDLGTAVPWGVGCFYRSPDFAREAILADDERGPVLSFIYRSRGRNRTGLYLQRLNGYLPRTDAHTDSLALWLRAVPPVLLSVELKLRPDHSNGALWRRWPVRVDDGWQDMHLPLDEGQPNGLTRHDRDELVLAVPTSGQGRIWVDDPRLLLATRSGGPR